MAIIATRDVGIGNIAPTSYIRIFDAAYHTYLNQWEIEVWIYFDKDCRRLEAIIEYLQNTFLPSAQYQALAQNKKDWLQNNVLCRVARPVQTMKRGTIDLTGLPTTIDNNVLSTMYGWLKTNPIGQMDNPQDDLDEAQTFIDTFITNHPQIFG
jgi:hypothetical protein